MDIILNPKLKLVERLDGSYFVAQNNIINLGDIAKVGSSETKNFNLIELKDGYEYIKYFDCAKNVYEKSSEYKTVLIFEPDRFGHKDSTPDFICQDITDIINLEDCNFKETKDGLIYINSLKKMKFCGKNQINIWSLKRILLNWECHKGKSRRSFKKEALAQDFFKKNGGTVYLRVDFNYNPKKKKIVFKKICGTGDDFNTYKISHQVLRDDSFGEKE